ncbi:hypothetical protein CYMTET_12970 [Cymbomonas tetramitiformis]|uniref:Uncharacterized protein n=1 Tax=Cymbomonas tetramitiformis TaxID=36881 RepID=A0AAE0GJC8_9CHLO|nr:hypothetical protein CYMTET_12970 [Cymbomonas tetramitiformis]
MLRCPSLCALRPTSTAGKGTSGRKRPRARHARNDRVVSRGACSPRNGLSALFVFAAGFEEFDEEEAGKIKGTKEVPKASKRWYKVTVRGQEWFRYPIPVFFPDMLPDVPREDLTAKPSKRGNTYVWKRSVIAGVEASVPRTRDPAPPSGQPGMTRDADSTDPDVQPAQDLQEPGVNAMQVLTWLLFLIAFLLTFSRAILPESGPAIMD